MHRGVSRKIPCLAGSPPVPLCSLRVVVPGLPSLISACPQSLTRSAPSPILLPHPFQICAWGHLGPSLAISKVPILSQPPGCVFPRLLSLHASSLLCMGPDYGQTAFACCAVPCASQPHSCCVLSQEGWHGTECVFKVCRGEQSCENKLIA